MMQAVKVLSGPALLAFTSLLLRAGMPVDGRGPCGMQPLHLACSLGLGELSMLLLRFDADPRACCHQKRWTPLQYALDYFARDCWQGEDYTLARACCSMLRLTGSVAQVLTDDRQAQADARNKLAHAATELALFKPFGGRIDKAEVLSKAGIPHRILEIAGNELWTGWPFAFLRFDDALNEKSKSNNHLDPHFVDVRYRLLLHNKCSVHQRCKKEAASSTTAYDEVGYIHDESDGYASGETWEEHYATYKARNTKWNNSRCSRRPRRVAALWNDPDASSRVSLSTRLARRGRIPRGARLRRRKSGGHCSDRNKIDVAEAQQLAVLLEPTCQHWQTGCSL